MRFLSNLIKMPRNIAYLRASNLAQDNFKNKIYLLTLAIEKGLGQVEFVENRILGKVSWKDRFLRSSINSKKATYC